MLLVLVTYLLFVGIATVSFFISYYVTIMSNQGELKAQPTVNNVVMTQTTILVQTFLNSCGDIGSLIAEKAFGFVSNIRENLKVYINLAILLLIVLSYTENKPAFLLNIDKLWRCGINPLFVNIIMNMIQVMKVVYGAFIPIYNYDVLIGQQLLTGTGTSILLCSGTSLFTSLKIVLNIYLNFFKSIGLWTGIAYGEISTNNNILVNDLPIRQVIRSVQRLVLQQSTVSSCICEGLTEVFEFVYVLFRQEEMVELVHHAVNFPIALVQEIIKIIPPWGNLPTLIKPMNHLMGFIFYLSKYMDQVLIQWIIQLITLFDDGIEIRGVPEEFFLTIFGRLGIAAVHGVWTLLRIGQTFSLPLKDIITNSDYQLRAFSLDQTMEHLNLAIIAQTDLIAWGLKIQYAIVDAMTTSVSSQVPLSVRLPDHVHLKCNLEMTNWIERDVCALRLAEMLVPDLLYTGYTLFVEILWKSLVNQEENVIQMLQRYDGISHPRSAELTCEYRSTIEYDFTAGNCRCDHGFGEYKSIVKSEGYPFGKPYFEKYCEQPNLQSEYFGAIERISSFIASGFYQNVKEITEITTLVQLEFWRTLWKTLLNLEHIVSGDYFMYKVNCGYGMSSKQLRLWWNSTDNSTTLVEKFERQRNSNSITCDGLDQLPYYNTVSRSWKCKLIDSALRDLMCLPGANADGKNGITVDRCQGQNKAGCECNWALANYCTGHQTNGVHDDKDIVSEEGCIRTYSGGTWNTPVDGEPYCFPKQTIDGIAVNSTTKEDCEKVTVAGVWTGPIDPLNKCQCIRNFPDDVMVYTQTAFTNPVVERFHSVDVSLHWCNTFWLEWQLYYIGRFATVVEKALGVFHPAYSNEDDGSNPYCEQSSFTLFDTKLLRYPLWKFNLNKDLFDALQASFTEKSCTLYGTTDMVCSTGLTIRQVVYTFINEIRAVVMAASNLLDMDFSTVKITFSERLCDLARALAAFSSIPPSILPDAFVGVDFQKGVSQLFYVFLNMPIAILDGINYILVFLGDLIAGRLDWSQGASGPVFKLVFGIVNIAIDWFRMILHALGNVLNGIVSGAGEGLFSVDKIVNIIQKYLLNEAAAELLELVVQVATQLLEFFTSGTVSDGFNTFFANMWTLLTKGIQLLLKNVGKVMGAIMDMLGPVGTFIRTFANSVCNVIEDVLQTVTFDWSLSLGCGFRHHHHHRRHLFSTGNETSEFQNVMWHLAHKMEWNGTSDCDMFIHSYKDYKWDDLRPIEHIKLIECIENRMIMREMSEQLNMTLPEDLLYNWRRKWLMLKDFAGAAAVFIEHKIGKISTTEMIHKFKSVGISYNDWLPRMNQLKTHTLTFFSLQTVSSTIETLFREVDPQIEQNKGVLNSVYRLYDIGKRCGHDIYQHSVQHKVRHRIGIALRTAYTHLPRSGIQMPHMSKHLKHGYETWNRFHIHPQSHSKIKAKEIILRAAGLQSGITPCTERSDSYVCLNCVVLDNFLNVLINDGLRMSNYYENVYAKVTIPDFHRYWTNNTESQAWREDAALAFIKAFDNVNDDADQTTLSTEIDESVDQNYEEGVNFYQQGVSTPATPRPTVFHGQNQSISFFQRARNDWTWFFTTGWNPFKDHSNDPYKRLPAMTVLVNFFSADTDTYVEYFAYSARHYLRIPFEDCPSSKCFCTYNTFAERQALIKNAWGYMFWYIVFWWVVEYQTGFPVFTMQVTLFIPICVIIYLLTVYSYTWKCFPSIPNCLMDDFYTYVHDNWFPSCFCYYFPALSQNCNPDTCFLCSKTTEFRQCQTDIPLVDSMGLLWAPLFFIRKNSPWILVFLYETIPFAWLVRRYEPLVEMTQAIIENVAIQQIELDCLSISYVDIVFMLIALWTIIKLFSIIVPLLFKIGQHATNLAIIYVTIIYSMMISLETQASNGLQTEINVDTL